mgnify:CR=1 FL=1
MPFRGLRSVLCRLLPPAAARPPPLVVATDLDGTLLDHDSYAFACARPALQALRRRRDAGHGPFTAQSCDNLLGNGRILRQTVWLKLDQPPQILGYAARLDLLRVVGQRLLEQVSFAASDRSGGSLTVDADYVDSQLGDLVEDEDLRKYIL